MSQVKWLVTDRTKAMKEQTNSKYIETDLRDILLNWKKQDSDEKIEIKWLKVRCKVSNFVTFFLYSSEHYTKRQNKMYQNYPILTDMYQLVIENISLKTKKWNAKKSNWMKSETASSLIESIEKISMYKPNDKNWVTLDELNEMMLQIDEIMEKLDVYQVMDELSL